MWWVLTIPLYHLYKSRHLTCLLALMLFTISSDSSKASNLVHRPHFSQWARYVPDNENLSRHCQLEDRFPFRLSALWPVFCIKIHTSPWQTWKGTEASSRLPFQGTQKRFKHSFQASDLYFVISQSPFWLLDPVLRSTYEHYCEHLYNVKYHEENYH